jgi:uncharacterized protein
MVQKTKYDSYCINGIAEGCKYCVRGEKLVLFVSGKCSRQCWYCSLSNKRKNKDLIFANEREIKTPEEAIKEVKESRATSAGITGGDPLLNFERTIKFASALKKKFGKKFHIHIYLPTKLVTKEKLEKLKKCVDEVRFHPEFLINNKDTTKDIKKIELASKIFGKKNTGIELPMIPDRKEEVLDFILGTEDYVSFVNLNEFELSETNFDRITKEYELEEGGYVAKGSIEAGKWILKELENGNHQRVFHNSCNPTGSQKKSKLKVHLCTAELKNCSQFANRLKRHTILPYGKKTEEGMVIYLIVNKKLNLKGIFYDEKKKRTILSESVARKLLKEGKEKITRVEEFPTYDRIETEEEVIGE